MENKVAYLEKTDTASTLTTFCFCAVWQLYAAEKEGYRAYINWPRDRNRWLYAHWDDAQFNKQPNAYDWYFEQPHFAPGEIPPRNEVWQWEAPAGAKHAEFLGKHGLYGLPIPELRAFYRKNLRLNSAVNQRGEALQAKYNIDFANTMAVTWRGTDCTLDGRPRLPIEKYFKFIDQILEAEPNLRILATAEEQGILEPLFKRYQQAFTISEWLAAPLGAKDNPEKVFTSVSGFERGMQPALMLWVLSRCKHLIKNRSSVTAIASWMSEGNTVCLAHPENMGHGFDITKAEHNGKLIPL